MPLSYDLSKDEIAQLRRLVLKAVVRHQVSYPALERETGVPEEDIKMFVALEPLAQDQMMSLRAYLLQFERATEDEHQQHSNPFKELREDQMMRWLLNISWKLGYKCRLDYQHWCKMNPYRQRIELQRIDRKCKERFLKVYGERIRKMRLVMRDGDSFRLWWSWYARNAKAQNLPLYIEGLARKAPRQDHLRPAAAPGAPASGSQEVKVPALENGRPVLLLDRAAVGGAGEGAPVQAEQDGGKAVDLDDQELVWALPA